MSNSDKISRLPNNTSTDVPNEEQEALLPDGGGDRGHGTIMNP